MEFMRIDGANIDMSRITLGTWAIGGWMWGGTDEQESIQTIRTAIDKGITSIDTAPVYGFGRSEEIVGKALQEHGNRENIVLATKVALEWNDEGNKIRRNSSKERIFKEIDDSLRRLQTDSIDIYQIHWPDHNTPFEETAEAMQKLVDAGKIRAIGVSNFSPEQMDAFRRVAPIHVCQPPYNLFERGIEEDVKPYCERNNITTLTYGAICRGLLSGKMDEDSSFEGDDLRKVDPKFKGERYKQYLEAVSRLEDYALEYYDRQILHFAVRWILDLGVNSAIWGARRPDQLNVEDVFGWHLTEDDFQRIDQILTETIHEPVGPEFMAPPVQEGG
jgi:aryl-alcohol dehydrogenase-like predicted oxidoreductase